jgi:hypothetical protein
MAWRMAVTSAAGIISMADIFFLVRLELIHRSLGATQQTFGLGGQMASIFVLG